MDSMEFGRVHGHGDIITSSLESSWKLRSGTRESVDQYRRSEPIDNDHPCTLEITHSLQFR
jgi:hypothetical protein